MNTRVGFQVNAIDGVKPKFYLGETVCLAFIARATVMLLMLRRDPSQWLYAQSTELAALAQSVVSGQGLSSPFGGHTGPSAFLAPGYPILIAIIFWLFGSYTMASAVAILTMQLLFGTATVAVLMQLARRAFDSRVANLAGVILALSPAHLWITTLFWESSLSILLIVTILLCAVRLSDGGTTSQWAILGATSAIALLVNPSLALATGGIIGWTAWNNYRKKPHSLRGPIVAVSLCVALFAPWPIRNIYVMHSPVLFRTNMGYELWQGNGPQSNGLFNPELHPNVNAFQFHRYAALGELGYMSEKATLAKGTIMEDLRRFLRLTGKRLLYFWCGLGGRQISFIVSALTTTTSLLAMVGLYRLAKYRKKMLFLFMLPLVVFPLPYYLTHPDSRFRMVLDPLTITLSAYVLLDRRNTRSVGDLRLSGSV